MKIKKNYILLSFFAILLAMPSCSDVLDSSPAGRITLTDVFANNDKTSAFLNTCYADTPEKGPHGYFFWTRGPVEWCDDAWDADDIDVNWVGSTNMYNGTINSSQDPIPTMYNENFWSAYWTQIRYCNIFLQNIGTATVTQETNRSRWTAEAHILRAWYYEELLMWYGCSLPIETVPYELTQDFAKVKRSSYYDVAKFIVADCDSAIACATLPWRITDGSSNRVTRALAEAIKSRVILFAASPLYTGSDNHWEEAYNLTKACVADLDANGYALYTGVHTAVHASDNACFPDNLNPSGTNLKQYAASYNEYFTNGMSYSSVGFDLETIAQSRSDNGQSYNTDGIGAQCGYKTGTCPSQELVDAFETNDGTPILDLSNPYDDTHLNPNFNAANTLYNEQNPYVKRDPRFYADIYYNGSKRYTYWSFAEPATSVENYPGAQGARTRIIATRHDETKTGLDQSARMKTRTGYYERKFLHPTAGTNGFGVNEPRTKLFRFAEAILNYAEAAAEYGKLDEARSAVNRIRERVGMPDITETDQTKLILRIRNERRVEMAMEENRFFDVRRWCSPGGDLSKTDKWITAAYITRNSNGTYTYSRTPVRANPRLCYTNKYLKQPLKINEANLMETLTGEVWQNPGW